MYHAPPTVNCALCGRAIPSKLITLHHLTPKERGGGPDDRVPLCKPCHKQIHALYDNKHLDQHLASIASLRSDPAMRAFLKWVRKQPPTASVTTRMSNAHPDARRRR